MREAGKNGHPPESRLGNWMSNNQLRIAEIYVLVQFVIWLKALAYFILYGHGRALAFSASAFPAGAQAFDFWFHLAGQATIGVLALAFGKNTEKFDAQRTALIVLGGVLVHKLMYYLTATYPDVQYALYNFAADYVILFAVVLGGHLLGRVGGVKRIGVPVLKE